MSLVKGRCFNMWEALANVLKDLLEKHLFPFIASIALAIALIIIIPADFWVIVKIGKMAFGALVFCIAFLIIHGISYLFKFIQAKKRKKENELYLKQAKEQEELRKMEEIWHMVDAMSPEERQLIKQFIESNNEPYVEDGMAFRFTPHLLNSNWVVSTTVPQNLDQDMHYDSEVMIYSGLARQYKLKEDVFKMLKYSYEKFDKISHFE